MNAQFNKGILELCVLAWISHQDAYGYELVQQISKKIDISEGTVYPILRRITQDGLCETYLQESSEGPPRKYYRITPAGRQTLKKLLGEWNVFIKNVEALLKQGSKS